MADRAQLDLWLRISPSSRISPTVWCNMTEIQTDLFGATEARDEALDRVGTNAGKEFMLDADRTAVTCFQGMEFTTECVRLEMRKQGLPMPHHVNAWGSWAMQAQRKKLIYQIGRRRHCVEKVSHKRKTEIYRLR